MESLDIKVLAQLCEWLQQPQQNKSVWLCTVVKTWGSAPRRPGSVLASCNTDFVGSLSGGCVEDDLIQRLASGEFDESTPHYLVYGQSEAEAQRFNLPCGGTLGLLLEPLQPGQGAHFQAILNSLRSRQFITRHCRWPDGQRNLSAQGKRFDIALTLQDSKPTSLVQTYGPETHLFIIGSNEVSRHLAEFALALGYRVTVCDPRQDQLEKCVALGVDKTDQMPDDAILSQAGDANSAIVAVTHDPRIDDMGLMVAFSTEAFYIGAMGSRVSSKNRRDRLAQLGVPQQQLQKLHATIGIDRGSKTPAEIAVSILAEVVAARSGKETTLWHK